MKIVVRDQGIEMHVLAPVGDNPPLRGGGGGVTPINIPLALFKGGIPLALFKEGIFPAPLFISPSMEGGGDS